MAGLEYYHQLNRALSPGMSRWWKRAGVWWLIVAVILSLCTETVAVQSMVTGTNARTNLLTQLQILARQGHMLIIVGLWLEIAHLCRHAIRRLYEQTAAPALHDRQSAPVLLLATLWQGRWLVMVQVALSLVHTTIRYLYLNSPDLSRYMSGHPPGASIEELITGLMSTLALYLIIIAIYMLAGRRRYIWIFLILSTLITVYLSLTQMNYMPKAGSEVLVEVVRSHRFGGATGILMFVLLFGGLAWGRRYLGWVVFGLSLMISLLSSINWNIWPETLFFADHPVARVLSWLLESFPGLGAFSPVFSWQSCYSHFHIMNTGFSLQIADMTTGVILSVVVSVLRLVLVFLFLYYVVFQWIPAVSRTEPGTQLPWEERRPLLIRLGLIAVVSTLMVWQMMPCGYTSRLVGKLPEAPPAVKPLGEDDLLPASQIADQRVVADRIIPALEEYFADKGEYPPYLVGGGFEYDADCGWWGTGSTRRRYTDMEKNSYRTTSAANLPEDLKVLKETGSSQTMANPDPLIRGGYLKHYPYAFAYMKQLAIPYDLSLPVGVKYWSCLYSTPGDHPGTDGPGPMLYDAILGPEGVRTPAETQEVLAGLAPADYEQTRHLALGGRCEWHFPLRYDSYYSLFPRGDDKRVEELYRHTHPLQDCLGMPYFGYQRGEWLGGDEREAWLWFYGSNQWSAGADGACPDIKDFTSFEGHRIPLAVDYVYFAQRTPLRGLDILNARTGELEPDGHPDGICLLYKLRDGATVEVVDAPDL